MADQIAALLARANVPTAATRLTRTRAHFSADVTVHSGVPAPEERDALRRILGAEIRAMREQTGMSQWALACRAGCARTTVERLEVGTRRPTPSMLAALAVAHRRTIPPLVEDEQAVGAALRRLLDAAGASLTEDTPGAVRRRERRLREAGKLWQRHCRERLNRERAATTAALTEFRAAMRLLTPGNLDNVEVLDRALRATTALREAA